MARLPVLFSFLLVCFSNFSSWSQEILPRGLAPDGTIFTMDRMGDTLYLGGSFDRVGYLTGGAALISPTDTLPNLEYPPIEGKVYTILPDGNGGYYFRGRF